MNLLMHISTYLVLTIGMINISPHVQSMESDRKDIPTFIDTTAAINASAKESEPETHDIFTPTVTDTTAVLDASAIALNSPVQHPPRYISGITTEGPSEIALREANFNRACRQLHDLYLNLKEFSSDCKKNCSPNFSSITNLYLKIADSFCLIYSEYSSKGVMAKNYTKKIEDFMRLDSKGLYEFELYVEMFISHDTTFEFYIKHNEKYKNIYAKYQVTLKAMRALRCT